MTPQQMKAAMTKMSISHRNLAELAGVHTECVRGLERGDSVSPRDVTKIKEVFKKLGVNFS